MEKRSSLNIRFPITQCFTSLPPQAQESSAGKAEKKKESAPVATSSSDLDAEMTAYWQKSGKPGTTLKDSLDSDLDGYWKKKDEVVAASE